MMQFLLTRLLWRITGRVVLRSVMVVCELHVNSIERLCFEFDLKWPPIDDDEFIRRCSPGMNRERALRVRQIIATQTGIPYEQIYPEQRIVIDLACC